MFKDPLEQSFAALSSRDKMKFLRWAAESVGAKLAVAFDSPGDLDAQTDRLNALAGVTAEGGPAPYGDVEIPEFLKRKTK